MDAALTVGRMRITVKRNAGEDNWPWTAWLEEWDGTEWRSTDAEDGDSRADAIAELRRCNRLARSLPA